MSKESRELAVIGALDTIRRYLLYVDYKIDAIQERLDMPISDHEKAQAGVQAENMDASRHYLDRAYSELWAIVDEEENE